eukprot:COSAG02_NODE_66806_length_254_cov_1.000000_1_plen_39_part_10
MLECRSTTRRGITHVGERHLINMDAGRTCASQLTAPAYG